MGTPVDHLPPYGKGNLFQNTNSGIYITDNIKILQVKCGNSTATYHGIIETLETNIFFRNVEAALLRTTA